MNDDKRQLIGGEEWCTLPDLGLAWVKSRVDSGARTSALHAWGMRRFWRDGRDWVSFRIHPLQRDRRTVLACEAPLVERRGVKSSSGATEARYVINTTLQLAGQSFAIEITLTSRDSMGYRMLLGREAMQDRLIVDPSRAFLCRVPSREALEQAYAARGATAAHLTIGVLVDARAVPLADALKSVADERGHVVRSIDTRRCSVTFEDHHEQLHCEALPAGAQLDVILSLSGSDDAASAGVLLRHFEHLGAYNPNPSRAALQAAEKADVFQTLSRSGMPLPVTRWFPAGADAAPADAPRSLVRSTSRDGGAWILTHGGREPGLCASHGVLRQSLPAQGELVRCFVAGTRVVTTPLAAGADGALERPPGRAPRLSPEARRVVRRAVRALGVNLARVDVWFDGERIMILDVDPFVQAGVSQKTAAAYANALMRYLERVMGSTSRPVG